MSLFCKRAFKEGNKFPINFCISLVFIPWFVSVEYNLSSVNIIVNIFEHINLILLKLSSPLICGVNSNISNINPFKIISIFCSTEIGFSENFIKTSNKFPINSSLFPLFEICFLRYILIESRNSGEKYV